MPAPSVVLTRLGFKKHRYSIRFSVEGTRGLGSTKGMLLRACHRQLYHAGLLSTRTTDTTMREASLQTPSLPPWRLLRDLVLFESLDETPLSDLVEQLELVNLESGDVLFLEDSTDATLYMIASGVLQLTRGVGSATPDTIGAIGAGDYVGEIGLLTGVPHAVTATALARSRIYKLSRAAIAPLLAANADLATAFDKSARHGLSMLHREVAVRATPNLGAPGQLLSRIHAFFHSGIS